MLIGIIVNAFEISELVSNLFRSVIRGQPLGVDNPWEALKATGNAHRFHRQLNSGDCHIMFSDDSKLWGLASAINGHICDSLSGRELKTTLATSRHINSSLPLLPSGPGGVYNYLLREDQGGTTILALDCPSINLTALWNNPQISYKASQLECFSHKSTKYCKI